MAAQMFQQQQARRYELAQQAAAEREFDLQARRARAERVRAELAERRQRSYARIAARNTATSLASSTATPYPRAGQ
jgi:hypothetical protein